MKPLFREPRIITVYEDYGDRHKTVVQKVYYDKAERLFMKVNGKWVPVKYDPYSGWSADIEPTD
jgi:hypothetical protein